MRVDTKDICATIAYLIGVKKHIVIECFDSECHDLLEKLFQDKEATTIRYLCKLRTVLMQKFKKTDEEMRYNVKNLNKLDWYDHENIKQLEKWGFEIIKVNYRSEKYALDFTKLIHENIDKCSRLFADWVNWGYIKDLFIIPGYTKKGVLVNEFNKYMSNMEYYPFQMYIHWQPTDCGSIIYSDGKFLNTIYRMHNDIFTDTSKFKDAHEETKNNIYDFINNSYKTAIAVDCENSDVYKLYGVLKNLNQDELSKIEKIVLYDDYHTNIGWDWLRKFTNIPVEHIEVERVTDRKSIVDIKMTAGVCTDYYENGISSFIIVSSDSDFWGLISSLPKANFLVMYEYSKCGQAIKDALSQRDIYYCSIDDFCTGNIEELKRVVLVSTLEKYLPDLLYLNAKELATHIYEEARIEASEKEIENFYNKYIKTLRLRFGEDGTVKLEITK
ncbi:MAG: NYN domain-containing protein [Ruminococcus sp.]|nr:NYN domain-containing protein [Ruminococcus sp.]